MHSIIIIYLIIFSRTFTFRGQAQMALSCASIWYYYAHWEDQKHPINVQIRIRFYYELCYHILFESFSPYPLSYQWLILHCLGHTCRHSLRAALFCWLDYHPISQSFDMVEVSEWGYDRTVGCLLWLSLTVNLDCLTQQKNEHVPLMHCIIRNSHRLQSGTAISLELREFGGLNGHDYQRLHLNGWEKLSAWEFQETA